MPYQRSRGLPAERASKLGHLDVLRSPLVQRICASFEAAEAPSVDQTVPWSRLPIGGKPLPLVFAVDGSLQIIEREEPLRRAVAFVKTAVLRLDQVALSSVDPAEPHP